MAGIRVGLEGRVCQLSARVLSDSSLVVTTYSMIWVYPLSSGIQYYISPSLLRYCIKLTPPKLTTNWFFPAKYQPRDPMWSCLAVTGFRMTLPRAMRAAHELILTHFVASTDHISDHISVTITVFI